MTSPHEQLSFMEPEATGMAPMPTPDTAGIPQSSDVFVDPYREQNQRARDIVESRGEDLALEQTGIPIQTPEVQHNDDEPLPYDQVDPSDAVELPGQGTGRSNTPGLLNPAEARRRREQDASTEQIRQMQAAAHAGIASARARLGSRNRER